MTVIKKRFLLLFLLFSPVSQSCDLNLKNGYGPWDYFDSASHAPSGADPMGAVKRVTNVHLTPRMLALKGGATGSTLDADLDYTLRAVPNHPQALELASRLEAAITANSAKHGREHMRHTADCYFERALAFTPGQSTLYMLLGMHQHRKNEYVAAIKSYQKALVLGYESIELHYNLGLAYFQAKDYELAQREAEIAYQAGYPLDGLKNLLKKVSINLESSP